MSDTIDARTPRCGLSAPSVEEKNDIMAKSRYSRPDFCRLNNCSDVDYMALEDAFQHALNTVLDIDLDDAIEGLAEPGDDVKLFMLVGGTNRLKKMWAKAKVPFDAQMRQRFPGYFKHIGVPQDSIVKSHHPGDQHTDIVVLSDDERDKLLHRVWTREAEDAKKRHKSGDTSPTKKRRRVTKGQLSPAKELKTTRLPSVPRLWNSNLYIIEVVPAELTSEDIETDLYTTIPFAKFCDEDDYEAISKGQKTDLNPELFSVKKFCELVNESKTFSFEEDGRVALTKASRRHDAKGDQKKEWTFSSHREKKAEYYLQKMIEQMLAEAAIDPKYKFQINWKSNAVWDKVELAKW